MEVDLKEIIKIFLKVDSSKFDDNCSYKINKSNNTITLYPPIDKKTSSESCSFEEDYIFDEYDDNLLIYEEICQNTIQNALNGISFLFISYGDTSSNKLKVLLGDIINNKLKNENINQMGIFSKLLDDLIKKEKQLKLTENKIQIKLSYILVHDSEMFNLSNLKNYKYNDLNVRKLYENKYTIKNEENIFNIIKKDNIENVKDEIIFLNKIFNLLIYLEEKTEHKNIYSRSHICVIIYIMNDSEQITSIISFVILNGSEYLYLGKTLQTKFKLENDTSNRANRKILEGTKIALETQYTYESIYNLVKLKIFLDNNKESSNDSEINNILKKNKQNSKLAIIVYNILFNMKKTKFRIIGTITPTTGVYQNFKDTLFFLLDFYKIKKIKNSFSSYINNNDNQSVNPSDMASQQLQKMNQNQYMSNSRKDNYIFELENKINEYKRTIEEYNLNLLKRDNKIVFLEENYKHQINTLKKKLNFNGNINLLISGDENTEEANFLKNLKDASEKNIQYKRNIDTLQQKLENAEKEIKRLKIKEKILDENDTMIKYYISVQKNNEDINSTSKSSNELRKQIEELNNLLIKKDKVIEQYKIEIEKKTKLLLSLPKSIKDSTYINVFPEKKIEKKIEKK